MVGDLTAEQLAGMEIEPYPTADRAGLPDGWVMCKNRTPGEKQWFAFPMSPDEVALVPGLSERIGVS
jgi:hypothetical protein